MTLTSGSFARVLIGVDFAGASMRALEVARTRFPGAALCLAHVVDARVTAAPDMLGGTTPVGPDARMLRELEGADAQRLAGLAQEGEDTQLLVGDPVTGILQAAREWGADLIVVGTHARGALEHFFLGSTAEKLVARSEVPVLTVRGPA